MTDFSKPIIAAVNGYAIGIGCIVTYCCDMIVASEAAEWRLPQAGLGIIPAQGGTIRLARWVGKGVAMRAALGFPLHADEAFSHRPRRNGWCPRHRRDGQSDGGGEPHRVAYRRWPARLTMNLLRSGLEQPLGRPYLGDLYRFAMLEMTEDKAESHRSWRERRRPDFKGR